jgi:hypothetical protein
MSMRTNLPLSAAALTRARMLSPQSAGSTLSPSAVSLTLTFASSPSASIWASARSYSAWIATASSRLSTSSPRTSRVAFLAASFSVRTAEIASPRSSPAMYRPESRLTTGFGTAGSIRAIARSNRAKAGRF